MNLFNKYEAVGIFVSVAIMVLALSMLRFKSESISLADIKSETQGAVVAVTGDTQVVQGGDTETAVRNAVTTDGTLVQLIIEDVKQGMGAEVKDGDTVHVHYIGTLQDGTKFDSSYDRGEPFSFTVGQGKVIEGWEKGLLGMKVGGSRILVIPSDMAYGNRQVGPIAPNSNLVFSIELMKIE